MITDPLFYLAAIPAIVLVGISKGGLGAMALFGVPIMALVISPVQAAGILMPILILMDAVALRAFWGKFDKGLLKQLVPAGIVGVLLGWATAAYVDESWMRFLIGLFALLFTLQYWFTPKRQTPRARNPVFASVAGAAAGYTSFVAHAGAPPYQVYTLPLQMTPQIFAGTAVYFFAIINYVKLVPYFALGQLNVDNLATSAVLAPLAFASTLLGVWLVKVVSTLWFYRIMYVALFLVALKLMYDGAMELGLITALT